jgi:hypothetical protein
LIIQTLAGLVLVVILLDKKVDCEDLVEWVESLNE